MSESAINKVFDPRDVTGIIAREKRHGFTFLFGFPVWPWLRSPCSVERAHPSPGISIDPELTALMRKGSHALERRPQLGAALVNAKRRKCSIVIAKLNRLSRDVEFILSLMSRRVPFIVADP